MAAEISIGPVTQIPKGEGRTFVVEGQNIAVFHTRSGEVFAVQARCPHRGGPLADGLVGDGMVICPLHEHSFDLRSGAGIGRDECITAYAARLDPDGTIVVAVE
jgi:nitrite reductase (NADH) small subunit